MLSASETDRTTVEARPRAEAEQLLEDNLQLKRHKLEEASTCDGVVKLIKRYDRDRHATLEELNAGLAGIISRRKKLRRESHIRDDWEAEVVALQAQVHADGPRYKRLRNIKQKIAADLERDKQQVKQRQAPVGETTAPRPPHSVSVTPLELEFWDNGKVDANDTSLADLKALELGDQTKEAITHLRVLKKGRRELQKNTKRPANYWSRAYREIAGRGHKVLFFLCERLNIHVIDPPLEDAAAEDTKVRRHDFVTTVRSHDAKHGDVVFESECKAAFRYFPRVGATWKATEPPVAKALRESEINEDVHATRPGLAKILRMCTYISAFNLKKVKNGEKCVMRYVDEKKVSLCPRNDENVCIRDRDGNAVLRLLRWKGEAEEVNQVATQLAKFEDADDLGIDKYVGERARRAASYSTSTRPSCDSLVACPSFDGPSS